MEKPLFGPFNDASIPLRTHRYYEEYIPVIPVKIKGGYFYWWIIVFLFFAVFFTCFDFGSVHEIEAIDLGIGGSIRYLQITFGIYMSKLLSVKINLSNSVYRLDHPINELKRSTRNRRRKILLNKLRNFLESLKFGSMI